MYIPQGFLRYFSLWGTLGVWDSGRKREGGVKQMGEERAAGEGSKRVGSGRNYAIEKGSGAPHPTPQTWYKFDTAWLLTHQNQQYPAHQCKWKNFQMGSTDWPGRQYDRTVWCKALCPMHLLQHWPVLASVAPWEKTTEEKPSLVTFKQSHHNTFIEVFNSTVTKGLTRLSLLTCL